MVSRIYVFLKIDFMLFWQLCSGMDENAIGTYAELIFAPIDASFADDAPLLPSGFRIIPLESGKVSFIFCRTSYLFVSTFSQESFSHCIEKFCRMLPALIALLTLHLPLTLAPLETELQVIMLVILAV